MHLADAFIQSDLLYNMYSITYCTECITFRLYIFLLLHVFPGNWTHNLCAANAML